MLGIFDVPLEVAGRSVCSGRKSGTPDNCTKCRPNRVAPPMYGVGIGSEGSNITRFFSPVTLSSEWPTLGRLLFMVLCSCLGTTINGFFVAAFFVEHTLKRAGNVFLACVGLSDLIVTTGVMPVSAVVLLSAGEWDVLPVCQLLQFLLETATYCYSLFFVLVAIESYYRICRSTPEYEIFMSMRVSLITISVLIASVAMAGIGVYFGYDYDYCERRHFGNFYYRIVTTAIFHGVPGLITLWGLITSCVRVRRRAREHMYYKRSQQYERDFSTTSLNMTAYIFYIVAWLPYMILVHRYPGTSDSKYYHCVWIGVCRSIITSFLYSCMNRNFRRAFAHLFYYCCCKSTLTGSFNNRHRRALEYKAATGDVRVHIMHQAVNPGSSQRGASCSREAQEL